MQKIHRHALYKNEIPGGQEVKRNLVKKHPRLGIKSPTLKCRKNIWNTCKDLGDMFFNHFIETSEIRLASTVSTAPEIR